MFSVCITVSRFNRAFLINVGFRESDPGCDYIAMHDVDLLPQNPEIKYKFPESTAYHVSSFELHPKYDYPTFIGGILLISRASYKKVNGMSNKYWGWGLEDDEFYVRLRRGNIMVERPTGIRTGRSSTFRHVHGRERGRGRDQARCYNQRNLTRRLDKETGLSNTMYRLLTRRRLVIDNSHVNFLDIELGKWRMLLCYRTIKYNEFVQLVRVSWLHVIMPCCTHVHHHSMRLFQW